jgi:CBS domain-containing protein
MKVDQIMSTNVVCCTADTNLQDVARMMADYDCGVVPVVEDQKSMKIVGILTDRDIVCRGLGNGRDIKGLKAADCMTSEVFCCKEGDSIEECLQTMEQHHIRRVPIVDSDNCCCGIVSITNIAATQPEDKTGHLVKEVTEPLAKGQHGNAGRS